MNKELLKNALRELYLEQEEHFQKKYNRSLPFQDGLFDRWERAARLNFGKKSSIYNSAFIFGDVVVGGETWIGPFVILDASGGSIKIGSHCSIAAGVHVYTHDSVMWALSGGKEDFKKSSIVIGDNTYIGAQSIINVGVSIGSSCVIGANSFVNSNVSDCSIVAGSPAKVIGKVVKNEQGITLQYYRDMTKNNEIKE